jgi:hypothetical protein
MVATCSMQHQALMLIAYLDVWIANRSGDDTSPKLTNHPFIINLFLH